jgi:hypothetical protein
MSDPSTFYLHRWYLHFSGVPQTDGHLLNCATVIFSRSTLPMKLLVPNWLAHYDAVHTLASFAGYLAIITEDLGGYPQSLHANTGITAQIKSNDVLPYICLFITFQGQRVRKPRPALLCPQASRRLTSVEKFGLRKWRNRKKLDKLENKEMDMFLWLNQHFDWEPRMALYRFGMWEASLLALEGEVYGNKGNGFQDVCIFTRNCTRRVKETVIHLFEDLKFPAN